MSKDSMKKLIFINDKSFLKKDYDRFGFNFYVKKNVDIELWQINNIVHKHINLDILSFDQISIIKFSDKNYFIKKINEVKKDTQFIMHIYPDNNNQFVFNEMYRLKLKWSYLYLGNYPASKFKFYQKIQLAFLNPSLAWDQIKIKFRSSTTDSDLKYVPHSIFTSGNIAKGKSFSNIKGKLSLISCNAFDYDKFLNYENEENIKNIPNKNYILYLDNYLPKHQDSIINGYSEKNCETDIFYKEINNFFEYVEELHNCSVIIAAYPKANYDKSGNPFNNRKIIVENTLQKVKYAKQILTHNSTSVNFAAIYKIPIIFISSIHYSLGMRISIEAMAKEFNQIPLNISKNYKNLVSKRMTVDNEIYSNYINKYIVSSNKEYTNKYSYEVIYKSLFNVN